MCCQPCQVSLVQRKMDKYTRATITKIKMNISISKTLRARMDGRKDIVWSWFIEDAIRRYLDSLDVGEALKRNPYDGTHPKENQ